MKAYGQVAFATIAVWASLLVYSQTASPGDGKSQGGSAKASGHKLISSLPGKEQDVLEQAFRHLLTENIKRVDYKDKPFFLVAAVGDQDLGMCDAFLKKLADTKLTIRKGTHWKQNGGTRLTVSIQRRVSETEVELDLKMYRNYLESLQYTCRFHLKNGKWQIKKGSERHFLQS